MLRLHLRPAERHPLPGTDVRLRPLDLLPLQSVWQRHEGTVKTGNYQYLTCILLEKSTVEVNQQNTIRKSSNYNF